MSRVLQSPAPDEFGGGGGELPKIREKITWIVRGGKSFRNKEAEKWVFYNGVEGDFKDPESRRYVEEVIAAYTSRGSAVPVINSAVKDLAKEVMNGKLGIEIVYVGDFNTFNKSIEDMREDINRGNLQKALAKLKEVSDVFAQDITRIHAKNIDRHLRRVNTGGFDQADLKALRDATDEILKRPLLWDDRGQGLPDDVLEYVERAVDADIRVSGKTDAHGFERVMAWSIFDSLSGPAKRRAVRRIKRLEDSSLDEGVKFGNVCQFIEMEHKVGMCQAMSRWIGDGVDGFIGKFRAIRGSPYQLYMMDEENIRVLDGVLRRLPDEDQKMLMGVVARTMKTRVAADGAERFEDRRASGIRKISQMLEGPGNDAESSSVSVHELLDYQLKFLQIEMLTGYIDTLQPQQKGSVQAKVRGVLNKARRSRQESDDIEMMDAVASAMEPYHRLPSTAEAIVAGEFFKAYDTDKRGMAYLRDVGVMAANLAKIGEWAKGAVHEEPDRLAGAIETLAGESEIAVNELRRISRYQRNVDYEWQLANGEGEFDPQARQSQLGIIVLKETIAKETEYMAKAAKAAAAIARVDAQAAADYVRVYVRPDEVALDGAVSADERLAAVRDSTTEASFTGLWAARCGGMYDKLEGLAAVKSGGESMSIVLPAVMGNEKSLKAVLDSGFLENATSNPGRIDVIDDFMGNMRAGRCNVASAYGILLNPEARRGVSNVRAVLSRLDESDLEGVDWGKVKPANLAATLQDAEDRKAERQRREKQLEEAGRKASANYMGALLSASEAGLDVEAYGKLTEKVPGMKSDEVVRRFMKVTAALEPHMRGGLIALATDVAQRSGPQAGEAVAFSQSIVDKMREVQGTPYSAQVYLGLLRDGATDFGRGNVTEVNRHISDDPYLHDALRLERQRDWQGVGSAGDRWKVLNAMANAPIRCAPVLDSMASAQILAEMERDQGFTSVLNDVMRESADTVRRTSHEGGLDGNALYLAAYRLKRADIDDHFSPFTTMLREAGEGRTENAQLILLTALRSDESDHAALASFAVQTGEIVDERRQALVGQLMRGSISGSDITAAVEELTKPMTQETKAKQSSDIVNEMAKRYFPGHEAEAAAACGRLEGGVEAWGLDRWKGLFDAVGGEVVKGADTGFDATEGILFLEHVLAGGESSQMLAEPVRIRRARALMGALMGRHVGRDDAFMSACLAKPAEFSEATSDAKHEGVRNAVALVPESMALPYVQNLMAEGVPHDMIDGQRLRNASTLAEDMWEMGRDFFILTDAGAAIRTAQESILLGPSGQFNEATSDVAVEALTKLRQARTPAALEGHERQYMELLLRRPDVLPLLGADPEALPKFVNEVVKPLNRDYAHNMLAAMAADGALARSLCNRETLALNRERLAARLERDFKPALLLDPWFMSMSAADQDEYLASGEELRKNPAQPAKKAAEKPQTPEEPGEETTVQAQRKEGRKRPEGPIRPRRQSLMVTVHGVQTLDPDAVNIDLPTNLSGFKLLNEARVGRAAAEARKLAPWQREMLNFTSNSPEGLTVDELRKALLEHPRWKRVYQAAGADAVLSDLRDLETAELAYNDKGIVRIHPKASVEGDNPSVSAQSEPRVREVMSEILAETRRGGASRDEAFKDADLAIMMRLAGTPNYLASAAELAAEAAADHAPRADLLKGKPPQDVLGERVKALIARGLIVNPEKGSGNALISLHVIQAVMEKGGDMKFPRKVRERYPEVFDLNQRLGGMYHATAITGSQDYRTYRDGLADAHIADGAADLIITRGKEGSPAQFRVIDRSQRLMRMLSKMDLCVFHGGRKEALVNSTRGIVAGGVDPLLSELTQLKLLDADSAAATAGAGRFAAAAEKITRGIYRINPAFWRDNVLRPGAVNFQDSPDYASWHPNIDHERLERFLQDKVADSGKRENMKALLKAMSQSSRVYGMCARAEDLWDAYSRQNAGDIISETLVRDGLDRLSEGHRSDDGGLFCRAPVRRVEIGSELYFQLEVPRRAECQFRPYVRRAED